MSSTGFLRSFRAKAVVGCSFALVLSAIVAVNSYAAVTHPTLITSSRKSVGIANRTAFALLGEGIPINVGLPNSLPQSSGFYVSVTVNSVPTNGTSVKLDVSDRTHIAPPSGNWPYTITFAPNSSTTATIWVTTSGTPSSSEASFVSCKSDLDISDPANWTALASSFWENSSFPPGPPPAFAAATSVTVSRK